MNFAILVLAGLLVFCLNMVVHRGYTPSATVLDFATFIVVIALLGAIGRQATFKSK
jgi:hypothetical protein